MMKDESEPSPARHADGGARPLPELIVVAPADQAREGPELRVQVLIWILLILSVVGCAVLLNLPRSPVALIITVLIALFGSAVAMFWGPVLVARAEVSRCTARNRRWRAAMDAKQLQWNVSTAAQTLSKRWTSARPPTADAVCEVLASDTALTERAHVVCLGVVDVPEIADMRFQPVVVTPAQRNYRRLFPIAAGAVLVFLWGLDRGDVVPRPFPGPWSGAGGIFAMAAAAAFWWTWETFIRARYLRLAPGMIQIVEYSFLRRHPVIRSYPMLPGTIVVLKQSRLNKPAEQLILLRPEQRDDFDLRVFRGGREVVHEVVHDLLKAALSTAPTPPLSDEELVA